MKTLEELIKDFLSMCGQQPCERCKYNGYENMGECGVAYAFEQLVGNEPPKPATASKVSAVQLPKWCKIGAWVIDDDDLVQINEIDHAYIWGKVAGRDVTMMQPVERVRELYPVRFRPYEYEEAKGLLGKTMESSCDGDFEAEFITRVYRNSDGEITINSSRFDWLAKECNATIDGVPIGVPVVDEEAMKEVKNEAYIG